MRALRLVVIQFVDALAIQIVGLFTDTKRGKNAVQDIVGGGGSGDGIDRAESRIKIQQQHLVRDAEFHGLSSLIERFDTFAQQILMADAGYESEILLARAGRCYPLAQAIDPFARYG